MDYRHRQTIGRVPPLTLADHATLRVPVTVVSGQKFYAIDIGARIISWGAYNAGGRELYGGYGPLHAVLHRQDFANS
jgi:hypothetical protein